MRIIHVIDSIAPRVGGPVAVAFGLGIAQADLGHEVHIVCSEDARRQVGCLPDGTALPGHRFPDVHSAGNGNLMHKFILFQELSKLRTLVGPETVVHLHGVWEPLLPMAAMLCRCRNTPYVLAPHAMLDPWHQPKWRHVKKACFALGWQRMLEKVAFIHCTSEAESEFIDELLPGVRTHVVVNGVFPELFQNSSEAHFTAGRTALEGRSYILFLGRLHPCKGVMDLAEAYRRMAGEVAVDLVVVGPDWGEGRSLRRFAAAHGLMDRIHLVGAIPGTEKVAALRDASCFCLPSFNEGCSIAVLEALAAGIPVVITEGCHLPEVEEYGAGRIVAKNPTEIEYALRSVLHDGEAARRMSACARSLVEERFSWPRLAGTLTELYEKALSEARS